jgi:hypothetical protein
MIELKAEGADASPRTASQNDPHEWDDLRQANSAVIHSAPTGDREIPFRQNEETGVSGIMLRVARESRVDIAAVPQVPRR